MRNATNITQNLFDFALKNQFRVRRVAKVLQFVIKSQLSPRKYFNLYLQCEKYLIICKIIHSKTFLVHYLKKNVELVLFLSLLFATSFTKKSM